MCVNPEGGGRVSYLKLQFEEDEEEKEEEEEEDDDDDDACRVGRPVHHT